ncbi:MAG: hypothetical protein RBT61_11170 [Candidatus Kapabacteria bacterium]|nr:hypothetical protein [Candidatus Kapabacteria bacterium]
MRIVRQTAVDDQLRSCHQYVFVVMKIAPEQIVTPQITTEHTIRRSRNKLKIL